MPIVLSIETFEEIVKLVPKDKLLNFIKSPNFSILDKKVRNQFAELFDSEAGYKELKQAIIDFNPVDGLNKKKWTVQQAYEWAVAALYPNVYTCYLDQESASRYKAFRKNYWDMLTPEMQEEFLTKLNPTFPRENSVFRILVEKGALTEDQFLRFLDNRLVDSDDVVGYLTKRTDLSREFRHVYWFKVAISCFDTMPMSLSSKTGQKAVRKINMAIKNIENPLVKERLSALLEDYSSEDACYKPLGSMRDILVNFNPDSYSFEDRKEYVELLKQEEFKISNSEELMLLIK